MKKILRFIGIEFFYILIIPALIQAFIIYLFNPVE
jgi:hypothetical protein